MRCLAAAHNTGGTVQSYVSLCSLLHCVSALNRVQGNEVQKVLDRQKEGSQLLC